MYFELCQTYFLPSLKPHENRSVKEDKLRRAPRKSGMAIQKIYSSPLRWGNERWNLTASRRIAITPALHTMPAATLPSPA